MKNLVLLCISRCDNILVKILIYPNKTSIVAGQATSKKGEKEAKDEKSQEINEKREEGTEEDRHEVKAELTK